MLIDTNALISVSEANRNFSALTRLADRQGQVVIFKNNRPKYLMIDIEQSPIIEMSEDEKIDFVARRILEKHRAAFEELAK